MTWIEAFEWTGTWKIVKTLDFWGLLLKNLNIMF
jgi:hypothetical protein